MDNKIDKTDIEKINRLHKEIVGSLKISLEKAFEIGEILTKVKAKKYGYFTKWIEKNANFTIRTAQRYMQCYNNKKHLKNDTVSCLTDAYRFMTVNIDGTKQFLNNRHSQLSESEQNSSSRVVMIGKNVTEKENQLESIEPEKIIEPEKPNTGMENMITKLVDKKTQKNKIVQRIRECILFIRLIKKNDLENTEVLEGLGELSETVRKKIIEPGIY